MIVVNAIKNRHVNKIDGSKLVEDSKIKPLDYANQRKVWTTFKYQFYIELFFTSFHFDFLNLETSRGKRSILWFTSLIGQLFLFIIWVKVNYNVYSSFFFFICRVFIENYQNCYNLYIQNIFLIFLLKRKCLTKLKPEIFSFLLALALASKITEIWKNLFLHERGIIEQTKDLHISVLSLSARVKV